MLYLYIILSFGMNATANILLKLGSTKGVVYQQLGIIEIIKQNWILLSGLVLFGLSAVTYFLTLKALPVTVAYPTMVILSFLTVNIIAYFYLHEKINMIQFIGYIFMIIGLVLVFYFRTKS